MAMHHAASPRPKQTCQYDDGMGERRCSSRSARPRSSQARQHSIPSREFQSVAVHARVCYAPHPYEWMTAATAHSTGPKIESGCKEVILNELTPWLENKFKVFPQLPRDMEEPCDWRAALPGAWRRLGAGTIKPD